MNWPESTPRSSLLMKLRKTITRRMAYSPQPPRQQRGSYSRPLRKPILTTQNGRNSRDGCDANRPAYAVSRGQQLGPVASWIICRVGPAALRRAGPPPFFDVSSWWAGARSELVPPYFETGNSRVQRPAAGSQRAGPVATIVVRFEARLILNSWAARCPPFSLGSDYD